MRRTGKAIGTLAAATSLVMVSGGVGYADDVAITQDSISVRAGQSATINVSLAATDGGNDVAGCNATTAKPVTIALSSSKDWATVSPASVTVTDCTTISAVTVSVASGTAAASTTSVVGSASGGLTVVVTDSKGKTSTTTSTFKDDRVSVVVAAPNTAPSVSVSGVSHGSSYEAGAVPAAGCSVTDAEDTSPTASPVITGTLNAEGVGSQTATCSYTDGGGLSASSFADYGVVDTTAPTLNGVSSGITEEATSIAGAGVSWDAPTASGRSGETVSTSCSPISGSTFGFGTTQVSCAASDASGNTSSAQTFNVIVQDTAAPALSNVPSDITEEATSMAGASVSWTAPTATGMAGETVSTSCSPNSGSTFALGTTQVSCTASDALGNTSSAQTFNVIVRDTTVPTGVTFSSTGVQDGGSYLRNFVPAAPTCSASDAVSTPTCVVTGYSGAAGTRPLTATATDAAGNSSTATISYTVRTLTISAFGSPVDGNGVLNVIKGGNTVPLKFTVRDGSTQRTDTAVVSSFSTGYVACPGAAATDEVETFMTTGSTSLRYDNGQFIQNWKTPTGAGKCLKTVVTTIDGSSQSALFKLK